MNAGQNNGFMDTFIIMNMGYQFKMGHGLC